MEPAAPNITIHSLQRFEVLSSAISPEEERGYWITPGTLGGLAPASSNGSGIASGGVNVSFVHPLEFYDRVFAQPLNRIHGKAVVQPAARVVLFFVHDAVPLHGTVKLVHHKCMVLLHVPNFHGGRRQPSEGMMLQPFQNWVFGGRDVNETMAGVEE
ncbi:hypothetical protein Vafri_14342 [Volvox africanus]|nr:hypothetical protein Vafri_14342 [Volvox africanus]